MDNKITLIVATTAGDLEEAFPESQTLAAVKREVMARLKLDPSQADQFVLTQDGNTLDERKTLRELGLGNDTLLTLERQGVVKI